MEAAIEPIDILIKDAVIYDGAGSKPFECDIAVTKDKISHIGKINTVSAKQIINAKGKKIACPGFIDVHGHSEFSLMAYPEAQSKLLQGVTTEIGGNCGFSCAPILNDAVKRFENEFNTFNIKHRWNDIAGFKTALSERKPAINFATLTGHGNLRASVIGYENKKASNNDLDKMAELFRQTIDDGSLGLSTGLIYSPGIFSNNEEIIEIIKRANCRNIIYASHMRSEGDALIEAIKDTIEVGRQTGVKINISHLKTQGSHNWHKIEKVLELIRAAEKDGINITCDRYPYTASQTSLDSILPAWSYEGGNQEELKKLKNKKTAKQITSYLSQTADSITTTTGKDYWSAIIVSRLRSEKNAYMQGMSIRDIANKNNIAAEKLVIEILIEEELDIDAIFFSMNEENLRKILSLDNCMVGSDSSVKLCAPGKPHPRGFSTFARYLSTYTLEHRLMPLETAIFKMTGLAAQTFNLKNRGFLKENHFADILIINLDELKDRATFNNPCDKPEGIEYVIVNGIAAYENSKINPNRAGFVI
ncbi:N-acyl-D-aspartate/D-glutamate deacylase [Candidatus Magnetoovum chiemensis]|nr:N-acyl-D-aspartate/D-glutamate deacylase [Candidatus Magnetoovum chiemensis]